MKKIKLLVIISALLLTPFAARSQSNFTIDAGAMLEIQTGADVCADTRTINGILTGNGTWCLLPLTPAAPVPVNPVNLSVGINLSLNLIWQRSFGAVTYRVQLATDSLFTTLIVNDSLVIDSVKAVSGLTPLTYYWWRVNAKGIGGTSSYSAVYKFRTLGYPNPVSLINPPNNSTNQPTSIQFRWSRASEQTSPFESMDKLTTQRESKIFINTGLAEEFDAISNYWFDMVTDTVSLANLTRDTLLTDTTKSVSGLSNLTNYWWRVKAKNQIGWGSYSVWYKFTTITAAPPPPALSSPSNNALGQNLALTLVWFKSSTAATYRVQVASDSLFTTLIVNDSTLTDSTRAVSGLNPLTNYWWRVNAKNVGGTSSYSAVYKFRTLGTPNPVSLINPPNNAINQPVSIQFRWSRASEQTSPFEFTDKQIEPRNNKTAVTNDIEENFDAISNYWFDMVTDTVSMANLTRDTLLTDTTKSVSGLNNNTNYWWRVKAKNQIGWGSYSVWYKFTTITAAPPPPALSSPSNNALGQNLALTLVWFKSSTASTYRVQVATDSLFTTLIVNDSTLTDSIRAVSGLTPLTNYWWRVNAKNIGGTSSYSAVYKFRTLGTPNPVLLINPPNNAINQPVSIQFRWSRASEQTSPFEFTDKQNELRNNKTAVTNDIEENFDAISNYWFDMVTDTVSMANLTRDTLLTDTTKSVSGLANNTNYWWRVKAKNQIGWGSYSVWYKFTTITAAPPPPVLVNPLNNAVGQNLSLTLVWNKSSTAATYRVQVATDSLFTTLIVNDSTLTDSTKAVSGLTPLTNYWWRVNAKNIGGTSSYSAIWKFKTLGTPTQVILVSPANGATSQPLSITFLWRKSADQTLSKTSNNGKQRDNFDAISNYWYELVTDTVSMANLVRDSLLTDTTKVVSGLVNATTYYWHVRAKNQLGWGQYSAWWRLTTLPLGPAQVTLTVIPGGFYNTGTGRLNMRDTIKAMLIDSTGCVMLDSARGVIDSVTFSTSISFANVNTGKYYLYIFHRNHIFISARYEQNIVRGSTVSYNFTTDSAKAYGFMMIKVSTSPVRWGMIPGDANRDGFIDGLDQTIWLSQNGLDGYLSADFNGDLFVDGLDQTLWLLYNGQSYFVPCELTFENPGEHKQKVNEIKNKQIENIITPKQNRR